MASPGRKDQGVKSAQFSYHEAMGCLGKRREKKKLQVAGQLECPAKVCATKYREGYGKKQRQRNNAT